MKKSLVSGLGGATPSPNPLSYGQYAPGPVCSHMRLLALFSLLFVFLHWCSPILSMAAQSRSPNASAPQSPKVSLAPAVKISASSPQKGQLPSQTKNSNKKASAKNTAPHADSWTFSTQKARPVDSIWTQGMAPQALKKAAVSGLKDKALKKSLTAPEVPPVMPPKAQVEKNPLGHSKGTEMPLAKGMHLRGDMDKMSSGWHSSSLKNDLRIDQDMNKQETNTYGAYADIEAGDDVTLSAGPEFSHTRTQNATHSNSHSQTDTGSLGLGLHLKWDF